MKKSFITIFLLAVSVHFAVAQWVQQASPTTNYLFDVKFVDRQTGWIVGRGVILRTTDAGVTWLKQDSPGLILYRGVFINSTTGWVVGATTTKRGLLLTTRDGGAMWTSDSSWSNVFLSAVYFIDANNGWAAGGGYFPDTTDIVLRTTNGGLSWQKVYNGYVGYINDLFFQDVMNGWAVSEYGQVNKTNDGGITWTLVYRALYTFSNNSTTFEPLRRIQFTDAKNGWAVGGISGVETKLRTTDGGTTWQINNLAGPPTFGSSLHGLWMVDSQNGWTVGGANAGLRIEKTTDGGQTWSLQPFNVSSRPAYFESVYMFSMNEGWVVGDSGTILKLSQVTTVGEENKILPKEFSLKQNYPNPFNPSTTIEYELPKESYTKLSVFNTLGQQVAVLVDGLLKAGTHRANFVGGDLPSGVYYYRLEAANFVATRKLILLK